MMQSFSWLEHSFCSLSELVNPQRTASVVVIVAEDCTNGSATMKVDANEISQYGS